MTGEGGFKYLFSAHHDFGSFSCLQCNEHSKEFKVDLLLSAETSADSRFPQANIPQGNLKHFTEDPSCMKGILSRGNDVYSAVQVVVAVGCVGFEGCVGLGLGVVPLF